MPLTKKTKQKFELAMWTAFALQKKMPLKQIKTKEWEKIFVVCIFERRKNMHTYIWKRANIVCKTMNSKETNNLTNTGEAIQRVQGWHTGSHDQRKKVYHH